MSNWTQPVCERCWFNTPGWGWPPGTEGDESDTVFLPTVVRTGELDCRKCCVCGGPTICGIFVRVDPKTVPFPEEEENEADEKPDQDAA